MMGYFPMCMDLNGRRILLIGNGDQVDEKIQRLRPFGGTLCRMDTLTAADLTEDVAFVVVGDLPRAQAASRFRSAAVASDMA